LLHCNSSKRGMTMNASEIKYIEEQMRAAPRLPLSEEQYADIVQRAKRERAKAIGEMWRALSARIAKLTRELRDFAGSSNHGRQYR
jgi:phosphoribosylformylglycinamidine (FGAM) synthase-like enzyme